MISELAKENEFIELVITFFKAIQAHYPIDEKDEPIDEDLVHFANAVSLFRSYFGTSHCNVNLTNR